MIKFFLNRPTFAIVIAILLVLVGIFSFRQLPVEQFPSLTPVQILVTAKFPGASAQTMADCVAAPLEEAINGTENMTYMYSQSVAPGLLKLTVCFEIGTDPNIALIQTQNAVNLALSSLPIEVQKQGVEIAKEYPNILLFISMESTAEYNDPIFLSNYASTNISEQLNRLYGVSKAAVINARDYSMRLWLKPDRLAQLNMTPADVISAVQEQNGVRSIGLIGGEPVVSPNQLTLPVTAKGRLKDPKEFEEIILRAEKDGALVLLRDVCQVELGAQNYDLVGRLNGKTGAFIAIYQDVGTNAIDVSNLIRSKMDELSQFFPEGVTYSIPYDTTDYIKVSMHEVQKTLIEAICLVAIIIFIFLHSFRISFVPILAMLISIISTFSGMYLLGFSINTLTLFGLVLAVGIVVDDAIIVVENIERHMREDQLPAQEAAIKAMKEVTGPVIATALVLGSVFIPVAFLGGIPGQFYKQFAITISFSVFVSGFLALTLSPVLSVLLFNKPIQQKKLGEWFNSKFQKITEIYLKGAGWVLNHPRISALMCLGMLISIWIFARIVPIGFVPTEDQGFLIVSANLPDGASISRVEQVSEEIESITSSNPSISDTLSFSGYSAIDSIPRTQYGTYFLNLKSWNQRKEPAHQIIENLNQKFTQIPEASIVAFNPPDIPGIGAVGGFAFWILNEIDLSYSDLNEIVDKIISKAKQNPAFSALISSMKADNMELFISLDLAKARSYGVKVDQIYQTLQALLGSVYINQFNKFGHIYQVVAQAEPAARRSISDIGDVYVKSERGNMIPLKSLIIPQFSKGPNLALRFNNTPAALISIVPAIADSAKIISIMEGIAKEILPPGVYCSWGGVAYEEKRSGGMHYTAFLAAVILVFLALAALYERWSLPIAILMTIPFGIFGAFFAVWLSQGVANIYFQIGIVALIGLSAKNAILIVEFAKEERKKGMQISEAALHAARLRFRAIIMTSLTMVMGSLPLVLTSGAGAASRKSVGIGILGGVAIGTLLAIFFVPLFYKAMEKLSEGRK